MNARLQPFKKIDLHVTLRVELYRQNFLRWRDLQRFFLRRMQRRTTNPAGMGLVCFGCEEERHERDPKRGSHCHGSLLQVYRQISISNTTVKT
jgi:hypothetical protein